MIHALEMEISEVAQTPSIGVGVFSPDDEILDPATHST
jgi:hypothetical protein